MGESKAAALQRPLRSAAMALLLLYIFALGFMRPRAFVFSVGTAPADAVFPLLMIMWLAALATGQASLPRNRAWWVLGLYLTALALSVPGSLQPLPSVFKLATQVYLLTLPLIVFSLIETWLDLKHALLVWLAAAAVVAAAALLALLLFVVDRDNALLAAMSFHFGTLPPGNYPRLQLTFLNANMLCNYLSVSLMMALAAYQMGWLSRVHFLLLLGGMALAALFTISPGLGGIGLVGGLWIWLLLRPRGGLLPRLFLWGAMAVALLFIVAMAVTPLLHPTAPFLIELPLGITLAPAGRLMIWIDAAKTFLANPLVGQGLGVAPVDVHYQSPSGYHQRLSDAHNSFLSLAAQCGLLGLAAILLVVAFAFRLTGPFRLRPDRSNAVRLGLGLAFLGGFAYQGLGGSFEDARHLWLLFGLLLASARIERQAALAKN